MTHDEANRKAAALPDSLPPDSALEAYDEWLDSPRAVEHFLKWKIDKDREQQERLESFFCNRCKTPLQADAAMTSCDPFGRRYKAHGKFVCKKCFDLLRLSEPVVSAAHSVVRHEPDFEVILPDQQFYVGPACRR